jgi:hypothetical protein
MLWMSEVRMTRKGRARADPPSRRCRTRGRGGGDCRSDTHTIPRTCHQSTQSTSADPSDTSPSLVRTDYRVTLPQIPVLSIIVKSAFGLTCWRWWRRLAARRQCARSCAARGPPCEGSTRRAGSGAPGDPPPAASDDLIRSRPWPLPARYTLCPPCDRPPGWIVSTALRHALRWAQGVTSIFQPQRSGAISQSSASNNSPA